MKTNVPVSGAQAVLPAWRFRALSVQAVLLLAAAMALPALAHALGLPVRRLLPMHWPVLLAGLCYGWRAGAWVGLAAPGVSFLLSGMPLPAILPAMTIELGVYGFLAGFFRQTLRRRRLTSTVLSILVGRFVFVGFAVATGAVVGPLVEYLRAALLPGVVAGVAQVALLPPLSRWWVERERAR